MSEPLRALILEDSQDDYELLLSALQKGGFTVTHERVETEASFRNAIQKTFWDVVLSDYMMPSFGAMQALKILQEKDIDWPFIIVSGKIGETTAVDAMIAGAHDYVMKNNLSRLIPAICRELVHYSVRRQKRHAQETLERRAQQQAAIARLGERALAGLDLAALFQEAVKIVTEVLEIEHSCVLELTPDRSCFLVRACLPAGRPGTAGWDETVTRIPSGRQSQAGFTVFSNDPVVVKDLRQEERFQDPLLLSQKTISGASVVIHGQNLPFGILTAHADRLREFTGDDVHFLQTISNHLAIAIDRLRSEDAMRQSQKMESMGRLAGGIAHDFNNVLTIIRGFTDLLIKQVEVGKPFHHDLMEIRKSVDQASTLTRQLLAFSRKQAVQPYVFSPNDVIDQMQMMFRRLIGEDIELLLNLDSGAPNIKADRGQMEQVLMNLVVNARDAMPQGGRLTIATSTFEADAAFARSHHLPQAGIYFILTVTDTGVGMDAPTQEHLFEPFFTTKAEGKGTGLGLATVYGIVRQNSGHIEVSSAVGQGSCFRLYLPAISEAQKPEEAVAVPVASSSVPVLASHAGETVLVVEDERVIRNLARRVLSQQGYNVLEAANGEDALKLVKSHEGSIDLILTDIVMPQMGGLAFVEKCRLMHPNTRVLAMSGYSEPIAEERGLYRPGMAFLQKPFAPAELLQKVRNLLDGSDSIPQIERKLA